LACFPPSRAPNKLNLPPQYPNIPNQVFSLPLAVLPSFVFPHSPTKNCLGVFSESQISPPFVHPTIFSSTPLICPSGQLTTFFYPIHFPGTFNIQRVIFLGLVKAPSAPPHAVQPTSYSPLWKPPLWCSSGIFYVRFLFVYPRTVFSLGRSLCAAQDFLSFLFAREMRFEGLTASFSTRVGSQSSRVATSDADFFGWFLFRGVLTIHSFYPLPFSNNCRFSLMARFFSSPFVLGLFDFSKPSRPLHITRP